MFLKFNVLDLLQSLCVVAWSPFPVLVLAKAAASGDLEGEQEAGEQKTKCDCPAGEYYRGVLSPEWPILAQCAGSWARTSFFSMEL